MKIADRNEAARHAALEATEEKAFELLAEIEDAGLIAPMTFLAYNINPEGEPAKAPQ